VSEDVMSADSLVKENAELRADRALLRAYLSEARSELNDARAIAAALVEACEAVAAFIESYTPDSQLARAQPTFYGIFRVYGKNARAAAAAVRPQADALLARMADLSRQIGEQNTTIGYQDAMLAALRRALEAIDRHVVGACESPSRGMPEPCEACGEMRDIAHQALAMMKEVRS